MLRLNITVLPNGKLKATNSNTTNVKVKLITTIWVGEAQVIQIQPMLRLNPVVSKGIRVCKKFKYNQC